ncbi:MAG TPA: transposase [Gemmataceae bacterium]|nr:transposase [Gemmataceae bacterium]
MGRRPRLVADDLVYHALNRGNNRGTVFFQAGDFLAFLQSLAQTQKRYPFRLFAFCLISNHFHLVLQPGPGQNVSRILQSLTLAHTWHYHKDHGTSGHVWQGCFKSPVIEEDEHLLTVMRYVEANPLRAGMVADLASYPWSSYVAHCLGKDVALVASVRKLCSVIHHLGEVTHGTPLPLWAGNCCLCQPESFRAAPSERVPRLQKYG